MHQYDMIHSRIIYVLTQRNILPHLLLLCRHGMAGARGESLPAQGALLQRHADGQLEDGDEHSLSHTPPVLVKSGETR